MGSRDDEFQKRNWKVQAFWANESVVFCTKLHEDPSKCCFKQESRRMGKPLEKIKLLITVQSCKELIVQFISLSPF